MDINLPTLIAVIIYLVAILIIGIFASRMTKNLTDFVLGGRRLGPGSRGIKCRFIGYEWMVNAWTTGGHVSRWYE